MRIAIATYREMISPRFDCASTLRILEWTGSDPLDRREELLQLAEGCNHTEALLRQNVSALLCGGIRRCDYHRLIGANVDVIAGQFGPWLDVLRDYVAGRLKSQPSWERPQVCGRGTGRGQGRGMGQGMGQGLGRGRGQSGRGGAGQRPGRGGSGPRRR